MLCVYFVHENHAAFILFQGKLIRLARAHGQAAARRHHHHHAFGGGHALVQAGLEIEQARHVDEVQLDIALLYRCHGQRKGHMALDLFRVKIAHGVAILHTALPVGGFRQVQHGLHQAGFPCAAMACYKDIADVIVRVVHILFPLFVHARKACGNLYKNIIIFSSYIKDVTKRFSPKRLPKLCSFPCIYCQKAPLGTPEALWKLFQISNQRISLAAISSSKLAPSPVYTVVCCGS